MSNAFSKRRRRPIWVGRFCWLHWRACWRGRRKSGGCQRCRSGNRRGFLRGRGCVHRTVAVYGVVIFKIHVLFLICRLEMGRCEVSFGKIRRHYSSESNAFLKLESFWHFSASSAELIFCTSERR